MTQEPHTGWLIPTSWTQEGRSAAMGNWTMFWAIHLIALVMIVMSMLSCVSVLFHVLFRNRGGLKRPVGTGQIEPRARRHKSSFPTRLTMYIAIVDLIWGLSHLADHIWLIHNKTFPDRSVTLGLSINLWLFFGYQQMVHAVLSAYTYAKVCHNYQVKFGRYDWKFHTVCATPIVGLVPIFYIIGAFGPTGYWMLGDAKTLGGHLLILAAAVVSGVNAFATMGGYIAISKKLESHGMSVELNTFNLRRIISQAVSFGKVGTTSEASSQQSSQRDPYGGLGSGITSPTSKPMPGSTGLTSSPTTPNASTTFGTKSAVSEKALATESSTHGASNRNRPVVTRAQIAAHCLGNIMRSAGYLYIPMSMSLLAVSIALFSGVIEPFSVLIAVIVCNCSGIINGIAFFTNEYIKKHTLGGKDGQDGGDDD